MKQFELVAETRSDVGKGASRRLRRAGKLPGIVYGTEKETTPITLVHDDVLHQLEHEAFYSHILNLKLDNKAERVVLKDLQRHPYKPHILHIDLQRVSENEKLTMRVPLHFVNESQCVGVKMGGVISRVMTELEISCLPKDLPEFIEVDVKDVELNATVHLGDLKLPEGVEIYALAHGGNVDQPIVSVHTPKAAEEEVTEVEGVEEAEAGAEAGAESSE